MRFLSADQLGRPGAIDPVTQQGVSSLLKVAIRFRQHLVMKVCVFVATTAISHEGETTNGFQIQLSINER
jgi:hypothetical protein